ncbi:LacI family DNA-binding transcriptional regulator [Klebsiella pneumoniae subsp. pneumoniae]|nr:LacI family DNA-binding transcriptional regulator [Klebsiella pneumoniae subsp. pneumoniae]
MVSLPSVKPVTLYDVAEYAGVSYQTVSRVVNRASHASLRKRGGKVEAAMAQLNYIPNRVAQQLAGKQSLLIGVATSSLALHAPSRLSRRLNLAPINWVPAWWCRW